MPAPPPDALARRWGAVESPRPAATLLLAGPGYGKTTAMAWLAVQAGAPVLWYTADPDDADVAAFFHYLVAGMRAHVPQFGEELLAMVAGGVTEPKRLWRAFFEAIADYNLPGLSLAIDDAHHLVDAQGATVAALVACLDRLPGGVRVLVASRRRLNAGLARLRASGLITVLDAEHLRFTPEEQAELLRRREPAGGYPEALERQVAGLDGWPLGLHLLTHMPGGRWDGQMLDAYVAEEIYQTQPPERQALMRRAALLAEPTAEALRALVDTPALDAHLEALEADHLVMSVGDGYRFPAYLREFLAAEARRAEAPEELAAWHQRAAAHFTDRARAELALPHWVAAEAWDEAIAAGDATFPAMRYDGRQALIARWLEAFPPALTATLPALALWRGQLLARAGQHTEAIALYERARQGFEAREDGAGAFKAMVLLCNGLLIQQDMKRFGTLMLQALARQADGRDEDRVDLHLIRARSAEQRGDLALMQECNEAVLAVPHGDNVEIAASQCIALINMFTLAHHRGDFARARGYIERAVEVATARRLYGYGLGAGFLRAHLQLAEGEIAPVRAFIHGLPPAWPELLDWHDLACAQLVFGAWHQHQGEFKAAEEALERAMVIFEQAGHQEGLKLPLERLCWLAVQRRQYDRTAALIRRVAPDVSDWPDADALTNVLDLAIAVPHARALHLGGRPEAALAVLERAMPALAEQGARFHLVRGRLIEAAARLKLGDEAAARAVMASALAEAEDYRFLLSQDQLLWEELGPLTAIAATVPAVPVPVAAGTVAAAAPEGPRQGPEGPGSPLPVRVGRLSIRCFGGFEVRLDGVLVDQWPRKKSKLILAALALYRRGLALPELAEMLGPEEAVTLAVMKVSLSALRKTLEPALDAREPSRYVRLADERYGLNWENVEDVDVQTFELAMREGDRLAASDPVAAAEHYEAALAEYRGGLLGDGAWAHAFESERAQYRRQATAALAWLADFHQRRGDFTNAERSLVRATEAAPCDEDGYLALMRFYRDRGKPERARQVYWDCRKALKAQLGLSPSAEFEAAHREAAGA